MIAEWVGDSAENLDRWKLVVQGWIAAGHNKTNVEGMLDWFKQGKTTKGAPASNGKSTKPGFRLPDGV